MGIYKSVHMSLTMKAAVQITTTSTRLGGGAASAPSAHPVLQHNSTIVITATASMQQGYRKHSICKEQVGSRTAGMPTVELHGLPDVPLSCPQIERRLLKIHTQTACEDLHEIYPDSFRDHVLKENNFLLVQHFNHWTSAAIYGLASSQPPVPAWQWPAPLPAALQPSPAPLAAVCRAQCAQ
jgi:hypothetical protein